MNKVIFGFMLSVGFFMYWSYINRPPTDDEIFCAVYFTDVPDEVMQEPLMINLKKEICNG